MCGNAIKEGTEQCDDGNTKNGDGCSDKCTIEIVKLHTPTIVSAQSTLSQYILGGATSKVSFNVLAEGNGTATINRLKFKVSNPDAIVSVKVGDLSISAPVVGGIADIQGLSIPIQGNMKENIFAVGFKYASVGRFNLDSGTNVYATLTDITYLTNDSTVEKLSTSVSTPTMTLVGSYPYLIPGKSVS